MMESVVIEMVRIKNTTPMVFTIHRRDTPFANMAFLLSTGCFYTKVKL